MQFKFYKNPSFLNAFWSVLEVLIFPIALIAATPLFITKLGANQYGMRMLINSSLAFLDMLGFGVNETLIKFISSFRAAKNESKIQELIPTLSLVLLSSGILVIIAGFALYLAHAFERQA